MSTPPDKRETPPPKPDRSPVILLLGDTAETTWRMFVPTIGGGLLGWLADNSWHTAPWLSLVGVALGAVVAGALIWQQFKKVGNVK